MEKILVRKILPY